MLISMGVKTASKYSSQTESQSRKGASVYCLWASVVIHQWKLCGYLHHIYTLQSLQRRKSESHPNKAAFPFCSEQKICLSRLFFQLSCLQFFSPTYFQNTLKGLLHHQMGAEDLLLFTGQVQPLQDSPEINTCLSTECCCVILSFPYTQRLTE